jgi:hypothetical protein
MEPFNTSGALDERLASSNAAASTVGSRIMDGLDACAQEDSPDTFWGHLTLYEAPSFLPRDDAVSGQADFVACET